MNMITQAFETFLRSLRTVLISGPDVDFGRKAEQILAASNTRLTDLLPGLFQELGQAIFEDTQRREEWEAVRKDQRVLLTAFGELRFERRYYRHKETGEMAYLLDRYTRIQAKARVNGDVRQKAVTLSAQGSYSKSAAASSPVPISRMSVCNDVSDLERFPSLNADGEKRSVKHLYVEADEDHVSLQNGQKTQVKLVYVHEGAEERNGRRALIAPRYLAWPSVGDNDLLWETVSKYIGQQYVPGDIQHIFLSGDCASWIRKGEEWLYPCVPVMDSFHTLKALRELCGGKQERVNAFLHYAREDEFLKARELCVGILREGPKPQREAKRRQANYLLGNWQRIVNQRHQGAQGCSAEGHVSHILPERLSSRPLGWSISYGGFYTQMTAAIDTRIHAAVSNAFFNDRYTYCWGDFSWYRSALIFKDPELCGLIAPRYFCIHVGEADSVFDINSALPEIERAKSFFAVHNASEKLKIIVSPVNHTLTDTGEELDFLMKALSLKKCKE